MADKKKDASGVAKKPSTKKAETAAGATDAPALDGKQIFAVLRVRGLSGVSPKQKHTMLMLNLKRSNQATIVKHNISYDGMLKICKDYITWGPISREVLVKMIAKRGRTGSAKISADEAGKMADALLEGKTLTEINLNKNFRLSPPSGGWKQKKRRYPQGDLGPRESMDEILRRMI
ncbi:50S ribosomal protein L30 [Candidatus Micrarchaeota archaeon CG10_big_fil_rev_8_21_14_0_10_45_29]|nr:MAG: 50S ribosomal protein L30 [Candidatus Micrarchaeota archaeon CG10_big_fil_rev_8_21_14_0_10_45_29]